MTWCFPLLNFMEFKTVPTRNFVSKRTMKRTQFTSNSVQHDIVFLTPNVNWSLSGEVAHSERAVSIGRIHGAMSCGTCINFDSTEPHQPHTRVCRISQEQCDFCALIPRSCWIAVTVVELQRLLNSPMINQHCAFKMQVCSSQKRLGKWTICCWKHQFLRQFHLAVTCSEFSAQKVDTSASQLRFEDTSLKIATCSLNTSILSGFRDPSGQHRTCEIRPRFESFWFSKLSRNYNVS